MIKKKLLFVCICLIGIFHLYGQNITVIEQNEEGDKVMRKIRNKTLIYAVIGIICTSFFSTQCSMFLDNEYPIYIHNNADHSINFLLSRGAPLFPDTLLPDRFYDTHIPIKPGSYKVYGNSVTNKKFIQFYGSDTIIVFIFHTDTLSKYSWEEIREGYKILKRYDVSWQEMERLKGWIYYPPTEAMKDMRMYPPYGSE